MPFCSLQSRVALIFMIQINGKPQLSNSLQGGNKAKIGTMSEYTLKLGNWNMGQNDFAKFLIRKFIVLFTFIFTVCMKFHAKWIKEGCENDCFIIFVSRPPKPNSKRKKENHASVLQFSGKHLTSYTAL